MNIKVGLKAIEEASEEAVELGPLGQGRPDRHAQSRHAAGHRQCRETREAAARCSRSAFRSTAPGRRPACSAAASIRSTRCSQPAPTPIAGQQDWNKIRYADDTLMLCVQGATHWDALGHIFYEDKAYNGHDAKLIDCARPVGARHRAFQEQDGRPRRAARHRALPRRAVDEGRRRHLQRRTRQMRARRRVSKSARAISCMCAPARWSAACRKANGAAMPAATRRA